MSRASATLPHEWRHFHVFLPTAEACPYPILVNGAFAPTSRGSTSACPRMPTTTTPTSSATPRISSRAELIPLLRPAGTEAVLRCSTAATSSARTQGAAGLLHAAITDELAHVPLLPTEDGAELALAETVLPTALLDEDGEAFRGVLRSDAAWDDRRFPVARFCAGQWARIAADHGAT